MKWPEGIEEIKQVFGDPRPYLVDGGLSVSEEWPNAILSRLELPAPLVLAWDPTRKVHSIRCHHLIKQSLGSILSKIHEEGLWKELEPYGGTYCWRMKRTGGKLSVHAWGAALDFRAAYYQMGTDIKMHPAVVEAFESEGYVWGGRWHGSNRDDIHFQACSGF